MLCHHGTPGDYLEYVRRKRVDCLVAGEDRVDLRAALEELHNRYGVETVRVDSGETLNGALLRAGLVDEVSLIIHPVLVGGTSPRIIFTAADLAGPAGTIGLRLTHLERPSEGILWLRYETVQ